MAIDDEELMHLLLSTVTLVRRGQHHADGHDGPPPDADSGYLPPDGPGGGPYARHPGEPPYRSRHHGPGGSAPHQPPPPPPAQGRVLAMLAVKEGLSQKELAYLMGIRPQSLTDALGQLEAAECIERRRNPDDGRVVNVYLTDRGRARAEESAENRRKQARDKFAALDEHDKEELERILTKLRDALE